MKTRMLASLETTINSWLDENDGDIVLTSNIGELMAQAAAAVFDAVQTASDEADEKE